MNICWSENISKRPTFDLISFALYSLLQSCWSQLSSYLERYKNLITISTDYSITDFKNLGKGWEIRRLSSLDVFQQKSKIGTPSSYAHCFKCSLRNWQGIYVAKEMKTLEDKEIRNKFETTDKEILTKLKNGFKREYEAMERISSQGGHPNLVKFVAFYEDETNFILVMEYYPKGSLDSILGEKRKAMNENSESPFSSKEVVDFSIQILHGLTYLHENKIAHRDLKVNKRHLF